MRAGTATTNSYPKIRAFMLTNLCMKSSEFFPKNLVKFFRIKK